MSAQPPSDDAQRSLEQRALRNVRGLVDKIDAMEKVDERQQKRFFATLVVSALVLALVIVGAMLYLAKKPSAAFEVPAEKPPSPTAPSK